MKKLIIALIIISAVFCFFSAQNIKHNKENENSTVKAVWMAYYELSEFTKGNDEQSFKKAVSAAFEKLHKFGFNTVTVQVRPCADAFYFSSYFPSSRYFNGIQGEEMNYDPLQIMCELSDKYKLKIEAWINPYRVSQDNDYSKLCENNIALKWHNGEKTKEYVKEYGNKLYFNPAYKEVNELIVNGVKEIAENYSIDGIHFDDYFYPTTAPDFDADSYAASGSTISLADWRRQNVNDLMRACYAAAHAFNVRFGVSPQGTLSGCRDGQYSDAALWLAKPGYCDYLIPQLYWGLNYRKNGSDALSLGRLAAEWLSLPRTESVQLAFGLGAYRIGDGDEGDTSGPGTEWCTGHALATQATTLRSLGASGAALYRYAFLFANTLYPTLAEQEIAALREVWG